MYGHIAKMAEAAKKGIEEDGGSATIMQVPETLPQEVLEKMHAPPKPAYPVASPADLVDYDGILLGISTRYGGFPAQFKSFWDASGQLWQAGALWGKYAGAFVSTGGPGGGQESTYFSILTTLVHHGLVFVPLGYKHTNALWNANFNELHGGSPFGAGTFAGDGTRQPSELELNVASIQAREFHKIVAKHPAPAAAAPAPATESTEKAKPVAKEATTTSNHKAEPSKNSTATTDSKPKKRRSIFAKIAGLKE